jgi:hypothetical protein
VKLVLTGKSGVGKSSFINAIRNLKSGDPCFATTSSYGNTTKHATVYEYPGNPKITLHDLPGFGTTQFPKNVYEEITELHKYDYVLIFVGNIEENDIDIARKLKEMNKPFCFLDVVAKPGSPSFKLRIALIEEDFPTPDLPVTDNFTGSFLQLSRSSLKCVNAAFSPSFSMLSFNSSTADFWFSSSSLNAI